MSDAPISDRFEVDNTSVLMQLAGPQSSLLAEVARQSGAEVSLRGNVIHFAGTAENVVGLIYVAGYALDVGETVADLHSSFSGSAANPYLECGVFPDQLGRGTREISVRVDRFREYVAEGLPEDEMQVLAVSQRPIAELALLEAATDSAWRSKPTWGIVTGADKTIDPDLQRFAYARAAARSILELDAPHLVMQTHPVEVECVITDALLELSG